MKLTHMKKERIGVHETKHFKRKSILFPLKFQENTHVKKLNNCKILCKLFKIPTIDSRTT